VYVYVAGKVSALHYTLLLLLLLLLLLMMMMMMMMRLSRYENNPSST